MLFAVDDNFLELDAIRKKNISDFLYFVDYKLSKAKINK